MNSQLIERARQLGVSENDLRRMSIEMGSDDGAIPPAMGSAQMTTLASDLIDARKELPDPEGIIAEENHEQRMANRGILTELQKAQLDLHTYDVNQQVSDLESPKRNRYAALGRRVRSLRP